MKVAIKRVIPLREVPHTFYSPERDGVTFTLLATWRDCREKARKVLNGVTSRRTTLGMVFGGLVHGFMERAYKDIRSGVLTDVPNQFYVKRLCKEVEKIWRTENPLADAESLEHLEFSMILLEALMPIYFRYWRQDFKFKWERVESEFKWPITIDMPDGRKVKTFVRGKMDGSFVKKGRTRPWLFETKTKAYLNEKGEGDLADILPHDLQPNIYLIHLWWMEKRLPEGLLYNIIRRPGLRRKKNETVVQFAKRVAWDVEKRPEWYFVRLQMTVTKKDLVKNELELRDLVSDFILWWNGHIGHYKNSNQCQNKYGICGMLPICGRGDYTGFYKRDKVFRELADEL